METTEDKRPRRTALMVVATLCLGGSLWLAPGAATADEGTSSAATAEAPPPTPAPSQEEAPPLETETPPPVPDGEPPAPPVDEPTPSPTPTEPDTEPEPEPDANDQTVSEPPVDEGVAEQAEAASPNAPAAVAAAPVTIDPANAAKTAWVGEQSDRPADDNQLLTLQAALNAAPDGGSVGVVDGLLGFTGTLTAPRSVTVYAETATQINALWNVAGDFTTRNLTLTPTSNRAVVTVRTGTVDATIADVVVANPNGRAGASGVSLGGTDDITVANLTADLGGVAGSTGVLVGTGTDATIANAAVSGVLFGVSTTATGGSLTVAGGTISAGTTGVAAAPLTGSVSVTGTTLTLAATATNRAYGIDASVASAAIVQDATIQGFFHGVRASGPAVVERSTVSTTNTAINLAAGSGARISGVTLSEAPGVADSVLSMGIALGLATDVVISGTNTITGLARGVFQTATATGQGVVILAGTTITGVNTGISLGATTNPRIEDVRLEGTFTGTQNVTGIDLVASSGAVITNPNVSGFRTGIGTSGPLLPVETPRAGATVTGARMTNVASGILLVNADGGLVQDAVLDMAAPIPAATNTGIGGTFVHDMTVRDVTVINHGVSASTGTEQLRFNFADGVAVENASLTGGGVGIYLGVAENVTVTSTLVAQEAFYGIYAAYGRAFTMTESEFRDNLFVGNFMANGGSSRPFDPAGVSGDITFTGNIFTGNVSGLLFPQGAYDITFENNTWTSAPAGSTYVLTATPAYGVTVTDNIIDFTPVAGEGALWGAIRTATAYADQADATRFSSSDVTVTDNTFTGAGPFVQTGSQTPEQQDRRSLEDTILVRGNSFPTDSIAIRTFANSGGASVATPGLAAFAIADETAVDARDGTNPNDWGSECKARATSGPMLDASDEMVYDGGGAWVHQSAEEQALYPRRCIDLQLTEQLADDGPYAVGDTVTWTLTPRNNGPGDAPAGWSVTQLLPDNLELVDMAGDGYTFDASTATVISVAALPHGADGPPIQVTARVTGATADEMLVNVAYISPLPIEDATDLDGDDVADPMIEVANPLVIPDLETDVTASVTNNDAAGTILLAPVEPEPPTPPSSNTPGAPADPTQTGSAVMASTGGDAASAAGLAILALGLIISGLLLRRRSRVDT